MEVSSGQSRQPSPAGVAVLPGLARQSVSDSLRGRDRAPAPVPKGPLAERRPVFVTIRNRGGELRGCVGTLSARTASVFEETWRIAREAAFSDPRFRPVRAEELPGLSFEVSVLHPLEDVDDLGGLDPRRYGVVVTTKDGRRAALLPDIEGVDTVAEQLAISRRKGGIGPSEPVRIQRFRVDKLGETAGVDGEA